MLEVYKEFAMMNQGFVNVKKVSDLKFPDSVKTPSADDLVKIKSTIDEVVKNGDFELLFNVRDLI